MATTHGMRNTKLYAVWRNMKMRCYLKNHRAYKNYGARGIRVCRAWHKPEPFLEWAKRGYREGLDLDRKDNSKGYDPSNCHWVERAIQNRNTRSNVWIMYRGRKMVLTDAAKAAGITRGALRGRLKRGWPESEWFVPPTQ